MCFFQFQFKDKSTKKKELSNPRLPATLIRAMACLLATAIDNHLYFKLDETPLTEFILTWLQHIMNF